jgi:hypothetical protein
VGVTEIFNVFGEVTKEEDVVLSNFTSDFNLYLSEGSKHQGGQDLRLHHHRYQ